MSSKATETNLKLTTPTDREIAMTRVFDAPRMAVFDALTKPEVLKRYFATPGWSLVVCEADLKEGGAYRYVWLGDDGAEMGMRGVYREIVAPERIVNTESFDEPWYPGEALDTTVLAEQDGKTTLTLTVLYESREARDIVLKTDMEQGLSVIYDKLAELLGREDREKRELASASFARPSRTPQRCVRAAAILKHPCPGSNN